MNYLVFSLVGLVFILASLLVYTVFYRIPSIAPDKDRELQEKNAILEVLLEGVVAFDRRGNILFANATAGQMFSCGKKKLEKDFFNGTEELVTKSLAIVSKAKQLGIPLTDTVLLEKGKRVYLNLIAVPQERISFLVLQDASSEQKILEMGKDFVANASHELKTPITIIRGFAETLQDMKDLPREIVEDILEKIVRNCQRMNTLVRSLLTLADIENIPLINCLSCDIGAIAEECKRALLSVYPTAQVEIIKEEAIAEVEEGILELALFNLLDNAAKYSPPPAKITVKVSKGEETVVVSVIDQGPGIPPHDIAHIFERFYTVNKAHSRKLGGAGLGLSLVKKIIEKHDGVLTVSSVLGEGTTFTFTLPKIHR